MPYLGICRGMQILNVALGGDLDQHLALDDGTTPHRRIVGTFEGNEQTIHLEPGSLAARALEEEVHEGRCHHHQAVDRLGNGLVVTGAPRTACPRRSSYHGGGWVLGVQWHPEAAEKRELFQSFVAAAREWAAEPAVAVGGSHRRSAPSGRVRLGKGGWTRDSPDIADLYGHGPTNQQR